MKEKMEFLLTGGAGLIGSNFLSALNQMGFEKITVVDHLGSSSKWKNLVGKKFYDYYEKDQFAKLLDSKKKFPFTHVIHLGACSATTETNASYLMENNFRFSVNLLEKSKKAFEKGKFLYASSAATYGAGENGYSDSIDIDTLKPLNAYGYSKQIFDQYCLKRDYFQRILALKYFNVYGFGEEHKGDMRSLVLKGYEQILQTGKLKLFKSYKPEYADGEQRRDFLYVKDAVQMSLHLLFGNFSGIYNIGSGKTHTWNELAKALFDSIGVELNVEYVEMEEGLKSKYQYFTKSDTTKFEKTKYNIPLTDFTESIKEYVALLNNTRN